MGYILIALSYRRLSMYSTALYRAVNTVIMVLFSLGEEYFQLPDISSFLVLSLGHDMRFGLPMMRLLAALPIPLLSFHKCSILKNTASSLLYFSPPPPSLATLAFHFHTLWLTAYQPLAAARYRHHTTRQYERINTHIKADAFSSKRRYII